LELDILEEVILEVNILEVDILEADIFSWHQQKAQIIHDATEVGLVYQKQISSCKFKLKSTASKGEKGT
jgi:hypothetical protein